MSSTSENMYYLSGKEIAQWFNVIVVFKFLWQIQGIVLQGGLQIRHLESSSHALKIILMGFLFWNALKLFEQDVGGGISASQYIYMFLMQSFMVEQNDLILSAGKMSFNIRKNVDCESSSSGSALRHFISSCICWVQLLWVLVFCVSCNCLSAHIRLVTSHS